MSATHNTSVRPEFDPESGTYDVQYDPESTRNVSTTLVLSLSSLTDKEPTQMRPLSRVVDPGVLNRLVRGRSHDLEISFEYYDHRITVRDDGQITFASSEDRDR